MTELEQKIDTSIGNETERARVSFVGFVAMGRELEREAMKSDGTKIYSEAELSEKIEAQTNELMKQSNDLIQSIFSELDLILGSAGAKASVVEKQDEDEAFAELAKSALEGPIKAEMIQKFEAILSTVDRKHAVIFGERNEALKALKAKYVPAASE